MKFSEILEILASGKALSEELAEKAMNEIASGNVTDDLIANFLTQYFSRFVTGAELRGFRSALLDLSTAVSLGTAQAIDVCGTGGDGKDTFNISTASALVVAACGVPVIKHGNYASSSKCGSSNVLEALGVILPKSETVIKEQVSNCGFGYLHAPYFHPALKGVAKIRKALGRPTIFNLLGPILNPAKPKKQLIGVYSQQIAELYRETLVPTNLQFTVVHALDGYDEVSLTGDCLALSRDGKRILTTEDFGFERVDAQSLKAEETLDSSATLLAAVLKNKGTVEQMNVVLANAALALQLARPHLTLLQGVEMGRDALISGEVYRRFELFREISKEQGAK